MRVEKCCLVVQGSEDTGDWRKLHNEELNDLYCSPSIVCVIKSRIMKWVGHLTRVEEWGGVWRDWLGKPEEKDHLGNPGVDGRIILKWTFRECGLGRAGSG